MVNIFVELSKYVILTLMVIYTFYCFFLIRARSRKARAHSLVRQLLLIVLLDTDAFLVLLLKQREPKVLVIYAGMMVFFMAIQILYRWLYRKASFLLLNNMCMLLSIGFIMQTRLSPDDALRQLLIAAASSGACLLIPVVIQKLKFFRNLTWLYALLGIGLLAMVYLLALDTNGAKLSLFGLQPSEFVKIIFVFFMASLLYRNASFPRVVLAALVAGVHILLLVMSVDLGSALIYFVTFLILVYISSRKKRYLLIGIAGGSGFSVAAYRMFAHVRVRVTAFLDPMTVYENEGYQVVQSLFAIGTGGWFGMGLYQGAPYLIPFVSSDCIFSAVCEELGVIFGVCLILVCMNFFLMIGNISLEIRNPFYKLVAIGLGIEYVIQVFLNIGGVIKFIPLTGVTLPLVSYGGSSILSTIVMIGIIQGLYIMREDEDEEMERLRR